nr:MAG TPA: hypothetical protein [Caudoviricetes sp.]
MLMFVEIFAIGTPPYIKMIPHKTRNVNMICA